MQARVGQCGVFRAHRFGIGEPHSVAQSGGVVGRHHAQRDETQNRVGPHASGLRLVPCIMFKYTFRA